MSRPRFPIGKFAIAIASLVAVVALIATSYEENLLIASVLALGVLTMFFRKGCARRDVVAFCIGAILGPSMEMIAIRGGAWQYARPSFFGIPLWLPLLWGLTAFAMQKITQWVVR